MKPESMDEVVVRNTASLMDAVNTGDVPRVRKILVRDDDIDVSISVDILESYAEEAVPQVMLDGIDSGRGVMPVKLLGCVFLQDDLRILQMILHYTGVYSLEDRDAMICIQYSTAEVHRMATNRFHTEMTNKALYSPAHPRPSNQGGYGYNVNFFSPMQILLQTLDTGDIVNGLFPRLRPFLETQTEKFRYMVERGAIYDNIARNALHMPILTHLLLEDNMHLAVKSIHAEFLDFGGHDGDSLVNFFIRKMKRNPILFLMYEDVCKGLTIRGDGVSQEILLNTNIIRKKQKYTLCKVTECVLKCGFVFKPRSYRIRSYDAPSRLYNLYRAGVYLIDDLNYGPDLPETDPITEYVLSFIEESKTPFRLEFLCKLFLKRLLGPRNHTEKIKELHLTSIVQKYLLNFKYTQNGRLTRPDVWRLPQARISGAPKYHNDDYDLV